MSTQLVEELGSIYRALQEAHSVLSQSNFFGSGGWRPAELRVLLEAGRSDEGIQQQPTILFVDDDQGNNEVLRIHFESEFDMIFASSGAEAMEILSIEWPKIGLVVSDQRMCGMTGTQLLDKIRRSWPNIELMLITAYSDIEPLIEAVNESRVSGYIHKPWKASDVRSVLREGLSRYISSSMGRRALCAMQGEQVAGGG